MRNPLLPVVAAFAAGIWSAQHIFIPASDEVLTIAVLLCGALLLLRGEWYRHGLICALAAVFLCGAFLAAEEHSVLPPNHLLRIVQQGKVDLQQASTIAGWVTTPSTFRPGGEYFDVQVNSIAQPPFTTPAEGGIRFYYYTPRHGPALQPVAYGSRVAITVPNLRQPRNFMSAGSFDAQGNMQRQGIYLTGIVRHAEDLQTLPGRGGNRFLSLIHALRGRLASNLDLMFPRENSKGAILKAMLLGDEEWLMPELIQQFQGSGTYHLLVVAGLHVGALAFGLMFLLTLLRTPLWLRTLIVLLSVIAYTLLANARIPTIRAALMISIYLCARLVYRERALLNSIAAAALILLIVHPADLFDPGFQLSFFAVLIIAGIAAPLLDMSVTPHLLALSSLDERERDFHLEPKQVQFRNDVRVLRDYLFGRREGEPATLLYRVFPETMRAALAVLHALIAVTLMQMGLAIVMTIYFHRVTWSGVAANLLVLPLAAVIIPLAFGVLFLSLVWLAAAQSAALLLGFFIQMLMAISRWSAHLPRLDRKVAEPTSVVVIAFAALLMAAGMFAARNSRRAWYFVAALVPPCVIITVAPYSPELNAGRLELTTLDVGQGDSLFISFPQGRTMVVDGGGIIPIPGSPPSRVDIGEQVVSPFLWSRRVRKIDVAMLTHAHADHLRGLVNVIQNFNVGELWLGPGPNDAELEHLLKVASERGVPVIRHSSGDKVVMDGVELLFLSPATDWNPKRVSNNDSLVVRLGYGRRHILLAGDAEARMERLMVGDERELNSDVLKVGHHGSKTSTTTAFLQRIGPRFGIISVGAFSRFGHPNAEVLNALSAAGVRTYRTDYDGSVTVSTEGNRLEFSSARDGASTWPAFRIQ